MSAVAVMSLAPYRVVLAIPALRQALVLGAFVRIPVFSAGVLLTVHVVTTLGESYAAAGLLAAVATVAIAVSGPWRGRLLDRIGLRRVVLPSTLVALVCWSIAPWVGYLPLLVLAGVAGLFVIPSFSIIRQAVIAAVPDSERRTAISLDGVAVEISFIVGPASTIWAASHWDTRWVLFAVQMLGVIGGIVLWVIDLPLRPDEDDDGGAAAVRRADWFGLPFVAVCLAAASATFVLTGTDLGIVARMRELGETSAIGVALALWGLGSLIGGLLYGALTRSLSTFWLLGALALVTLPMALASGVASLSALAFVAGLLCAPTITASVDQASRVVPASARGEAMGWHGSSLTLGGALGAPFAGLAIDAVGGAGGFLAPAVVGLFVAVVGAAAASTRRRRAVPAR
ncbi:putative MFS family arabinose efflux permease [Knoellia remsis]|uniref:Putative MFS family arabinose efflux permease n=1 Tax=Knoellia remsis TaxID=407159 RepID=A0A2T0V0T8_9MICO|nr:MFS transporter [Knoellia remsis]PRY63793.1 putative MFS family arabinose efflux permease [Knoellia remsis]